MLLIFILASSGIPTKFIQPIRSEIERPRTTGAVFPATETGVEFTPVVTQPIPVVVISPSLSRYETSQPADIETTSTSTPYRDCSRPIENANAEPTVKYPRVGILRYLV
jgi:hypothetical protein